jgi:D-arginine dehydrogenase
VGPQGVTHPPPTRSRYEVVIVGGGIAGAALAYFLAQRGLADVLLLERESQPGYHATGRSAATLNELDAVSTLQRLKVLSAPFLRQPPTGFAENRLLTPSGVMTLFREPLWSTLRAAAPAFAASGLRLELLEPAEAVARIPLLSARELDGALLVPDDGHLDVHELLTSYLRHAARRGVERCFGTEVRTIRVEDGRCTGIVTDAGEIHARWVVDAAGAWAGRVAALAGALPITLAPCRRTIVTFAAPAGVDIRGWPMVASEARRVYFAPESGGLLLSPMDETPMEPCDARPDDLAVAGGLERLAVLAPRLVPRTLRRKWAGLRTFAPDRVPVVGEDPQRPGFFWLAGQGGCGIETSPTLGAIAADLIVEGKTERFDATELSPARFA